VAVEPEFGVTRANRWHGILAFGSRGGGDQHMFSQTLSAVKGPWASATLQDSASSIGGTIADGRIKIVMQVVPLAAGDIFFPHQPISKALGDPPCTCPLDQQRVDRHGPTSMGATKRSGRHRP